MNKQARVLMFLAATFLASNAMAAKNARGELLNAVERIKNTTIIVHLGDEVVTYSGPGFHASATEVTYKDAAFDDGRLEDEDTIHLTKLGDPGRHAMISLVGVRIIDVQMSKTGNQWSYTVNLYF